MTDPNEWWTRWINTSRVHAAEFREVLGDWFREDLELEIARIDTDVEFVLGWTTGEWRSIEEWRQRRRR